MKKFSPKKILCIVLAVLLAAGGITGGLLYARNSRPVSIYPVKDLTMDYSWGDSTQTGGTVTADDIQSVYLSSTQQLKEVYVTEGQNVKKGELLLAFDTTLSELELTRKKLDVQKLELELEKAKKERIAMNGYAVYNPAPAAEEKELPSVPYLPYLRGGDGSANEPLIYVWSDSCIYSDDFINTFLKFMPEAPAEDAPAEGEAGGEEEAPATQNEGEEAPAEGGEGSEPAPVSIPTVYAVFEVRTGNSLEGDVERVWEMCFRRSADNRITSTLFSPASDYDKSASKEENTGYMGPTYTWSELQQMKAEADKNIREMEVKLKKTRLEAEKMEYELNNGEIRAKIDGVIKTLRTSEEALAENLPLLLLSGGGGYKITGLLGETDLENTRIGDTVNVYSWESGSSPVGTIESISEFPADSNSSNSNYSSGGNNNVSTYPFTVFVDEDANLREGEYVDITFSKGSGQNSTYLMAPFIRSEAGSSYVYVRGESGRLEKRTVKTGRNLWGSYVEVLTGLTEEDWVAFPYGSKVHDGSKTSESDAATLYGY